MFERWYRVGTLLGVMVAGSSYSQATVLKIRPWPMTDKTYPAVVAEAVRVERYLSETTWLEQVGARNPSLTESTHLYPVASIELTRLYEDEDIDSIDSFLEKARECAAKLGANAVFLEKEIRYNASLEGYRFIAYRGEYKKYLLPPTFLVALPQMTLPGDFLEEQLRDWEDIHIGRVAVAFGLDFDHDASLEGLAHLKAGTPVRVLLRDGSDFLGSVSGLDEEKRFWIRPKGWAGVFRDRAVSASDIRSVALLR